MGWISDEEVEQQCNCMDIESLVMYDKKLAQDVINGMVYPWRALRRITIPTLQEWKELVAKYEHHFIAVDVAIEYLEALEYSY